MDTAERKPEKPDDASAIKDIGPGLKELAASIEKAPENLSKEIHAVEVSFGIGLLVGILLTLLATNLFKRK